jgi:signal transduction histidine kinase
VQRSLANGAQTRAMLDRALVAAERGTALTQSLLAFARRQRLAPKPVDVPAIVDGIKERATASARAQGVADDRPCRRLAGGRHR